MKSWNFTQLRSCYCTNKYTSSSLQQRFANDERVYKAFLEILNMYRKGQKTIANVYEEVRAAAAQSALMS